MDDLAQGNPVSLKDQGVSQLIPWCTHKQTIYHSQCLAGEMGEALSMQAVSGSSQIVLRKSHT